MDNTPKKCSRCHEDREGERDWIRCYFIARMQQPAQLPVRYPGHVARHLPDIDALPLKQAAVDSLYCFVVVASSRIVKTQRLLRGYAIGRISGEYISILTGRAFRPDCVTLYMQGEVTSQNLWTRYHHHFVGITWHNVWSKGAKIYRVN